MRMQVYLLGSRKQGHITKNITINDIQYELFSLNKVIEIIYIKYFCVYSQFYFEKGNANLSNLTSIQETINFFVRVLVYKFCDQDCLRVNIYITRNTLNLRCNQFNIVPTYIIVRSFVLFFFFLNILKLQMNRENKLLLQYSSARLCIWENVLQFSIA